MPRAKPWISDQIAIDGARVGSEGISTNRFIQNGECEIRSLMVIVIIGIEDGRPPHKVELSWCADREFNIADWICFKRSARFGARAAAARRSDREKRVPQLRSEAPNIIEVVGGAPAIPRPAAASRR